MSDIDMTLREVVNYGGMLSHPQRKGREEMINGIFVLTDAVAAVRIEMGINREEEVANGLA